MPIEKFYFILLKSADLPNLFSHLSNASVIYGYLCSYMVVQILDKVVCVLLYANNLGKGRNPSLLHPAMGK